MNIEHIRLNASLHDKIQAKFHMLSCMDINTLKYHCARNEVFLDILKKSIEDNGLQYLVPTTFSYILSNGQQLKDDADIPDDMENMVKAIRRMINELKKMGIEND